jgi:hypothetical protein
LKPQKNPKKTKKKPYLLKYLNGPIRGADETPSAPLIGPYIFILPVSQFIPHKPKPKIQKHRKNNNNNRNYLLASVFFLKIHFNFRDKFHF